MVSLGQRVLTGFDDPGLGIIANEDGCGSPDSRIAIGGRGQAGFGEHGPRVGNQASYLPPNEDDTQIPAWGVVLVR